MDTKSLEVQQNKSNDFLILDDGDGSRSKNVITVVINPMITMGAAFKKRMLSFLLTFYLLAMPSVLCNFLQHIAQLTTELSEFDKEDPWQHLVLALIIFSFCLGLPLHLLSLFELVDCLEEPEQEETSQDPSVILATVPEMADASSQTDVALEDPLRQ